MLSKEQQKKIKTLTGFSYKEIMEMTDKQFFSTITSLLPKKRISRGQHDWLLRQRGLYLLDNKTREMIEIFGGKPLRTHK